MKNVITQEEAIAKLKESGWLNEFERKLKDEQYIAGFNDGYEKGSFNGKRIQKDNDDAIKYLDDIQKNVAHKKELENRYNDGLKYGLYFVGNLIGMKSCERFKCFGTENVADIIANEENAQELIEKYSNYIKEKEKERQANSFQMGDEVEVTMQPGLKFYYYTVGIYGNKESNTLTVLDCDGYASNIILSATDIKKTGRNYSSYKEWLSENTRFE